MWMGVRVGMHIIDFARFKSNSNSISHCGRVGAILHHVHVPEFLPPNSECGVWWIHVSLIWTRVISLVLSLASSARAT